MPIETKPWDVTDHLVSEDAIAGYLEAVAEEIVEGAEPTLMEAALKDVARARDRHRLPTP